MLYNTVFSFLIFFFTSHDSFKIKIEFILELL